MYKICVSIHGYAVVDAASEAEAKKKAMALCENDFNWEEVNEDILEDAVILEEDRKGEGEINEKRYLLPY